LKKLPWAIYIVDKVMCRKVTIPQSQFTFLCNAKRFHLISKTDKAEGRIFF